MKKHSKLTTIVALILDTCKAGGAAKGLGALALSRGLDEVKLIAGLARSRGIAVFSASAATQKAYEIQRLGHGIFTWCLLKALKDRGPDIRLGKRITVSRLLGVVNRMTRDTSRQHLGVEQSPVMYIFGDDFSLGVVQ